ncbi:MAG: tetratricopeptide repeat protein, partial [Ramlibacter sp.]
AFAQAEPTLDQVYKAAQAGQLVQAQEMMKKVLANHPTSGKAHYVEAELLARQGLGAQAREELALAEKLAPGLPFAKAASVAALRADTAPLTAAAQRTDTPRQPAPLGMAGPSPSSFPWGTALGFGALAAAVYVFILSRRKVAPAAPAPYYGASAGPGMAADPQPMGMGPGGVPYGAAPAPGMGGRIMGGLATGLAVGAGVVAAEEIGRRMMGSGADHRSAPGAAQDGFTPLDRNPDMGGNDFGVNDAGSWDDAGSGGGSDGGGSWD